MHLRHGLSKVLLILLQPPLDRSSRNAEELRRRLDRMAFFPTSLLAKSDRRARRYLERLERSSIVQSSLIPARRWSGERTECIHSKGCRPISLKEMAGPDLSEALSCEPN